MADSTNKFWKEVVLYPIVTAIVFCGWMMLFDWMQSNLRPVSHYLFMALVFVVVVGLGRFFIWRKNK